MPFTAYTARVLNFFAILAMLTFVVAAAVFIGRYIERSTVLYVNNLELPMNWKHPKELL